MPERPRAAIVAPFSGPRRAWGDLLQRAAARRDDIAWLEVDDEGRAELGAVCARRVVGAGCVAAVGHFNSGGAALALPEYAAAGVPCLLPLATAPGLPELAPGLVLRHCPTDDDQARALVAALGGEVTGCGSESLSERRGEAARRGGEGTSDRRREAARRGGEGTSDRGGEGPSDRGGEGPSDRGGEGPSERGGEVAMLGGEEVAVLDDASAYGVGLAERVEAAGATRVDLAAAATWRGGLVVSAVHRAAAQLARELAAAGCPARLAFVDDCGVDEFADLAGEAARGALVARFPDGGQACVDALVDSLADALTAGPAFRGRLLVDAIRASSDAAYDAHGERIGAAWDIRRLDLLATGHVPAP